MENKPADNFDVDIHNDDFLAGYRAPIIDNTSLIDASGRTSELLSGRWRFSIDQYDTFLRAKWWKSRTPDDHGNPWPSDFDWGAFQEIDVPSCWNSVDSQLLNYEGTGLYSRTFRYVPGESKYGERVFLKVGAANYLAYLFLDEEFLGVHRGGSTPFVVELRNLSAGDHRLTIAVSNRRERDQVPTDNTDWFNYGGIHRDVRLIRVPATFIRRWSVTLREERTIRLTVEVDSASGAAAFPIPVAVLIPELGLEQVFELRSRSGSFQFEAEVERWHIGRPKLYDVEVSIPTDRVSDRIGLRTIEVRGERIFLNGSEIYLKGISCHEDSLVHGRALDRQEIEKMFDDAAELGCNFLRLAHYPHSEVTARIADERGILLWEEIPVYWAIKFANASTYDDAANQLTELILRDINRASVILWSVGNENPDTDDRLTFMGNLAKCARRVDPSRLITAACLWNRARRRIEDRLAECLDVVGINEYFGWYSGDFADLAALFSASRPGKPVIVSEFGAGAAAGHFGTRDDYFTENKQRDVYERQFEVLGSSEYVCGMTPWVLYDFRSPRRLNEFQKGFNRKGLIAADHRTRKLAFHTLQRYYQGS